jgi:hypothetical protein
MLDAGYWKKRETENIQHQVSRIQYQFGDHDTACCGMAVPELET